MDNQQLYLKLAKPVANVTRNTKLPIRIVPKFRGDNHPFNSNVGDYVINEPKIDSQQNLYLEHGKNISLNDFNHLLTLNQKSPIDMSMVLDAKQHDHTLALPESRIAFGAPLHNAQFTMPQVVGPNAPFDNNVQSVLEQHSTSSHSMVNALGAVDKQAASQIKNDDKYRFGQYDDKVVDDLPADYFNQHPLPIGQTMNNQQVKTMLYNGHTMVMQSTRQQTNQAMQSALAQNGGSLLSSKSGSHTHTKKAQDFSMLMDPLAASNNHLRDQTASTSATSSSHDDSMGNDAAVSPNANTHFDHQSLSKALNQQLQQAVQQRYLDHQRLGNNDGQQSASEFEDNYEPKDFADVESSLRFEKAKDKLGQDDKSTKRTKYLTNLLTTRNVVTQDNDDSLLAEEMSNDNDDVTVDDRGNSDIAKKARQDKKAKYRQRRLDKQHKQIEMYAESVYAMKYHDDHGNSKFQYNMIPKLRDTHAFVNKANYTSVDGSAKQTHSMPISETDFHEIMKANGVEFSTDKIKHAVDTGKPITGKHDNIAFSGQLESNSHGITLRPNSVGPTATDFDYHREIEMAQSQSVKPHASPGLIKKAHPEPTKYAFSDLVNPQISTAKQHQSFSKALSQALQSDKSNHKQATRVAQQPSLG